MSSIEECEYRIQVLLNEIKIINYELDFYNTVSERRELINKYNKIKQDVKFLFEKYFYLEEKNNLPINLKYRSVYKFIYK